MMKLDAYTVALFVLATNLILLQYLDVLTTRIGIRLGGEELNPHIAPFQEHIPTFERFMVMMKAQGIFLLGIVSVFALLTANRLVRAVWAVTFGMLCLLMYFTVVNNLEQILLAVSDS